MPHDAKINISLFLINHKARIWGYLRNPSDLNLWQWYSNIKQDIFSDTLGYQDDDNVDGEMNSNCQ